MPRPFDELSSPVMNSMASQTSLAGPDDNNEYGQSWLSKRGGSKRARPRLPKIKSSPTDGGVMANQPSNYDRIHNRNLLQSSSSAIPAIPAIPTIPTIATIATGAHVDPYSPVVRNDSKPLDMNPRAKIKPLLRKFSSQEHFSIDLSRPAAENEGIGFYESSHAIVDPTRRPSGSTHRGYHNRNTSGASQKSTNTTGSNRYGTQPYVHPMQQTPLPYTSPIASYKNSLETESRNSDETSTPYAPVLSLRKRNATAPPQLHIRTGSSFTNSSQTNLANLPGTPSSLRYPTNPESMVSPATGRSSLESAFRRVNRSRSNTAQTDPAQQAASVQHLRQKFQEKEAAKDRKYQEAELRTLEKEKQKEVKRERKRAKSNPASEKSSLVGAYSHHNEPVALRSHHDSRIMGPPTLYGTRSREQQRSRAGTGTNTMGSRSAAVAGREKPHSQWSLFWFRVKTMLLRMKMKMGGGKPASEKRG